MPFRERLLEYFEKSHKTTEVHIIQLFYVCWYTHPSQEEDNLLLCLGDLFSSIYSQRKKTGVVAPKKFVQKLRKENGMH